MTELESADAFADRLAEVTFHEQRVPLIEADRAAVARAAKRELLTELARMVETNKWLDLTCRKESGWGRAYAEALRVLRAKYAAAEVSKP